MKGERKMPAKKKKATKKKAARRENNSAVKIWSKPLGDSGGFRFLGLHPFSAATGSSLRLRSDLSLTDELRKVP